MAAWSDFKHSQKSNTSIASTLSNEQREQVQQNRHYMKMIVEVLMFVPFKRYPLEVVGRSILKIEETSLI